ncbi:ABC transporter permease [Sarcina sp. JB2]|uniref:ABC transporter permease n=1 Tax=Candidatus Sarcina troglodytae TaxID=2726954 RepID=A0ACD1BBB6_9CLOT|nr:ABC transporter permease [Sarcina sp. JB2]QPJ84660.1 ABC transporter permease [Sarcina sp. JB2]
MAKYILKRIATSIITLWAVITITFFMLRLLPGGPFTGERNIPEAIMQNLEVKYGLDKPLFEQYGLYLKNLLQGDLGESMKYAGKEVSEIISYSFPSSAKLGVVVISIALIFGITLGIIAALKYNSWPDSLCMVLATLGVTIPSFVLATVLMYIFGVKYKLLPVTGLNTPVSYILPALALGGYSIAFISRLTRSKLLETLNSDYIRTARAKGVSGFKVIVKHALRNTLIPIITYLGPLIAGILTGSFVVEKIFAIPGLGREFVNTISNRDYTVIMGVTVFYSSILIICNLLVDLLYGIIDPRIKLDDIKQ